MLSAWVGIMGGRARGISLIRRDCSFFDRLWNGLKKHRQRRMVKVEGNTANQRRRRGNVWSVSPFIFHHHCPPSPPVFPLSFLPFLIISPFALSLFVPFFLSSSIRPTDCRTVHKSDGRRRRWRQQSPLPLLLLPRAGWGGSHA